MSGLTEQRFCHSLARAHKVRTLPYRAGRREGRNDGRTNMGRGAARANEVSRAEPYWYGIAVGFRFRPDAFPTAYELPWEDSVRPPIRETQTASQLPPRRYFAVHLDSGTTRRLPFFADRCLPCTMHHAPCLRAVLLRLRPVVRFSPLRARNPGRLFLPHRAASIRMPAALPLRAATPCGGNFARRSRLHGCSPSPRVAPHSCLNHSMLHRVCVPS